MRSEPGAGGPAPPADAAPPRRLHVGYVLVRLFRVLRGGLPALLGIAVGFGDYAVAAIDAVLVLACAYVVLEWRATTYRVADGALHLRRGLLSRSDRAVPAARISALDTSRGLVQRLFGLVSLEVQTAGGARGKAEVRLDALTFAEAERLRAVLGHAARRAAPAVPRGSQDAVDGVADGPAAGGRAAVPAEPVGPVDSAAAEASGEVVYAITGHELLVAALTGPQLGLVAALVGAAFSQAQDLLPGSVRRAVRDVVADATVTTVLVLVAAALVLAAVVSVLGTVLAFAEFTVVRDGDRLRVRRGLLTERTATIALDRIHGVRVVEGLLRRPLGWATVQVEVAGYRREDELTRTLVPLVRRDAVPALLARTLPDLAWPAEPYERPPARAHRRYWTRPVLTLAVPAVAAAVWLPGAWRAAAVLPLLLGVALGESRWRGVGWRLQDGTLAMRRQLLARTTLLARARRVQRVLVRSTPLQRRAGLAGVAIVLATKRGGRVRHLDRDDARALQQAVLAEAVPGRRTAEPSRSAAAR